MVTLNSKDPNDPMGKVLNDLSVGTYDVVMSSGPSFETKRQEGADNMLEMLKIEALAEIIAKTAPDLIFRSIDHPYCEEIADRLMAQTPDGLKQIMEQLPERARNVIMALSKQNQNLQQALQEAQVELKQGLAKAHLQAAVKAHDVEVSNETKRHDTEVRAETARFDTAVKSHTALAVEEIKAGASLLNTHAEAEHHRREAEMMIENADRTETAGATS
jgi:excinuclease UvrABC ATPase subunit